MPRRKLSAGENLNRAISASTWNDLLSLLDHRDRAGLWSNQSAPQYDFERHAKATQIWVRNLTGYDLQQFSICGISSPLVPQSYGYGEFEREVVCDVIVPTAAHVGAYVVTVDAIPSGQCGKAIICGAVQCRVSLTSESHNYAECEDGNVTTLVSGASGSAQILWREATTGSSVWCIVRLGNYPASSSTPSVYLTDFTRILASGSGSPGANQITRARAGAIYFQEAWGDPAEAGVEVLTDSANDSDDPSLRITTDGCYRLAVGFAGDDVTTFAIEDYYTTYDTSTVSSHAHTYKFFDTWHHAKAILYVSRRASGGSWDGSWIMYGASNREVFGGSGSYLGGGSTALTGGSWSYGTMRCFGMERFNFDADDELIFRLFYNDYSPISDTALTFEITNFHVEIARLSDQVTPETYALP